MSHCRFLDVSPTGDDLREFSYRLLNEHLFLPDVLADVKRLMDVTAMTFNVSQQPFALIDGKNKLGGVFFISEVEAGHTANVYIWVWERGVITPTTIRFIKDYIESIAEEYQLVRVSARTSDNSKVRGKDSGLGHLLKHLGFKEEGRLKAGYKSGGKLHTLFLFRKLFR